jgi:hypothetical protein
VVRTIHTPLKPRHWTRADLVSSCRIGQSTKLTPCSMSMAFGRFSRRSCRPVGPGGNHGDAAIRAAGRAPRSARPRSGDARYRQHADLGRRTRGGVGREVGGRRPVGRARCVHRRRPCVRISRCSTRNGERSATRTRRRLALRLAGRTPAPSGLGDGSIQPPCGRRRVRRIRLHDVRHTYATLGQIGGVAFDASFDASRDRRMTRTCGFRPVASVG